MKFIMMAAALMLGGAAVAQTTTTTTEEEADTAAEATAEDTSTTQTTTQTTAETTTTTQTTPADTSTTVAPPAPGNMSTMRTGSGQTVAPGNTSPETDARGIRVISAPAEAPAGYNRPAQRLAPGAAMPTVAAPAATAAGPLPPCSRTVTDRCTQTYERGRAR
jgi:cytoskeletal protein RodZ